jgi:hypothetical protein
LVEHWERRNIEALAAVDPENLDVDKLKEFFAAYAPGFLDPKLGGPDRLRELSTHAPAPDDRDEWRHVDIRQPNDIYDRFVKPFFFGVEAEDRTLAFGFSPANAFGARLQSIFSSDIGHWDVEDIGSVVPEAYGLVEQGLITEADFRDFTFTNPAQLYLRGNRAFFDGTAVESPVRTLADRMDP